MKESSVEACGRIARIYWSKADALGTQRGVTAEKEWPYRISANPRGDWSAFYGQQHLGRAGTRVRAIMLCEMHATDELEP